MAIAVYIVEENLITVIRKCKDIPFDKSFLNLRKIAREEQCTLVATIDGVGNTIINQLQLDVLKEEIMKLRKRNDADQELLNQLQEIVKNTDPRQIEYIKFMGD